jgi:hypothetical protein
MCLASKYIGEIDDLVERIKSDMQKLHNKRSEYDKKLSEFYHQLEIKKFNACEGYYISKQLQEILQKRRLLKNELYRMQHIYDTLSVQKISDKLPKTKNNVKKFKKSCTEWESAFSFTFSDIEDEILH